MKNINKVLTALLILTATLSDVFGQNELTISGGNEVSSLVCGDRKIYTWGNNPGGRLGVGAAGGAQVTVPTMVDGTPEFDALTFRQVNSGSGSHFLALDCNGTVWAWGNNNKGQVGNGSASTVVPVPTKVKLSPTTTLFNSADFDDGNGNLTGVAIVYAGNTNSFAILTDGRLVSWGGNTTGSASPFDDANGQLGNNKTGDQYYPDFVIDGLTNQPLKGVIKVFAGDNAAYALVDTDGDGAGTVYSWGNGLNGTLGRNRNGSPGNPGTVTEAATGPNTISPVAFPVVRANPNEYMDDIIAISALDVNGIALDVNGYVWTWGNNWNGSQGQGVTGGGISALPKRVVKGAVTGGGTDGTYLLATMIGGGQGFAMAVTADGKPVAWGNGAGCGEGGSLGNGAILPSGAPVYIVNGTTNQVDDDVVLINRGDTWGFYATADNKYYAWGCNEFGQLGINSTTTQTKAVAIAPPACGFKDPKPTAKVTPKDTAVCASKLSAANPIKLNAGFLISAALANSYQIRWYRNGVLLPGSPAENNTTTGNGITGANYNAIDSGTYKVKVSYIGTNGDCGGYKPALDSMHIGFFKKNFTVPTDLKFCSDPVPANVIGSGVYHWFKNSTGGLPLDTTFGNATTNSILKANLNAPVGIKYTLYVEEAGPETGRFVKVNNPTSPTSVCSGTNKNDPKSYAQYVTAYKNIVIDSVSAYFYGNGSTGTMRNFQVVVYPTIYSNGKPKPDLAAAPLYSGAVSQFPEPAQNVNELIKIPVNIKLPGSASGLSYWIGMRQGTNLYQYTTCTVKMDDDVTGNIVEQIGYSDFGNEIKTDAIGGVFFNIRFHSQQEFCDRVPVEVTLQCPCNRPKSVSITTPTTPSLETCLGATGVTLKGTYDDSLDVVTTDSSMYYVWYKKKTGKPAKTDYLAFSYTPAPPTWTVGSVVAPGTANPFVDPVTYADTGVWVLRVQHGNSPMSSGCYREDSVHVKIDKLTHPQIVDTATHICQTASREFKVDPTKAGSTYTWTVDATTGSITTPTVAPYVAEKVIAKAGNADSLIFTIQETTAGGCKGPIRRVSVPIDKQPTKAVAGNDTTICGNTFELKGNTPTVGTGKWSTTTAGVTFNPTSAALPNTVANNLPSGTAGTPVDIEFTWTISNGVCKDTTDKVIVKRSGDISDPKPTVDDTTICIKGKAKLSGTTPSSSNQEKSWWDVTRADGTPTTGVTLDTLTSKTSPEVTFTVPGIYRVSYTIDNPTCNPTSKTLKIYVIDSAKAEIIKPLSVLSPKVDAATYSDTPLPIEAKQPLTDYSGVWAATSPGSVKVATDLITEFSGLDFEESSTLTWSVQDKYQACPKAVATVVITRKDITSALAKNDTVCFSSLSSGRYTQVPINAPNPPEVGEWIAVGSAPVPAAGKDLDVVFTVAGSYTYTYRIYNPTVQDASGNDIESKNNYTIIVEAVPALSDADTTNTNTNIDICSTPYSLRANTPNYTIGERGGWKGTGVTFTPDTSDHMASITGLTDGASYTLTWTVYSKFSRCKASDQIIYKKLPDITQPTIEPVVDRCAGPGLNLVANDADATNFEKGTWTSEPANIIPAADVNDPTPPTINGLRKGTYKFTWTITSTFCTAGADSTISFKVDSIPTFSGIDTIPRVKCEGETGGFSAKNVSLPSPFPVTYKWSVTTGSAGAPDHEFIDPDDQASTQIKFTSKSTYKADKDSATVHIVISNQCGTSSASIPVIYRLTPRFVGPIGPVGAICGSATGEYHFGTAAQANAETYTWTFGGNPIANQFYPVPNTDSAFVKPSDWANVSSPAILKVALTNSCGTTSKDTTLEVPIITPARIYATVSTGKPGEKFCEPEDALTLTANVTPFLGGLIPVSGTYTFLKGNEQLGLPVYSTTGTATYTGALGEFVDGDQVVVKFRADTGQCLVNTRPEGDTLLYGFKYADSTITAFDTITCDNPDFPSVRVCLKNPDTKNTSTIQWYKVVTSGGVNVPVVTGTCLPAFKSPSDNGTYYAVLQSNVCVHDPETRKVPVRIYDAPNPVYSPDPFLIFYDKNSPGIPMPLVDSGTVDTIRTVLYEGDIYNWLSATNVKIPIIKTTLDEKSVPYTVTMTTGPADGSVSCPGYGKITVVNTLPLFIPNAFSPNGDGKNEVWVIDGLGQYPDTRVKVYNRWGSSMYTDNYGYKVPWDGTHNGVQLASGTYYYVVELKGSPTGKEEVRTGSLTIVR